MRAIWNNFTGGEVSASLRARYDLRKYGTALAVCENFVPKSHGDISFRPGTLCVAELEGDAALIPFRFNTEPENNYALIFMAGKIRVARADGMLEAEIASPYAVAEAKAASYAQVGDVLYLAHKKHPLRKITRSGLKEPYAWRLAEARVGGSGSEDEEGGSPRAPEAPRFEITRGLKSDSGVERFAKFEDYDLEYRLTAIGADGVESCAGPVGSARFRFPTDWVSGDSVVLWWPPVAGAKEYNVYRASAGYFGLIGVVPAEHQKDVYAGGTFKGERLDSSLGVRFDLSLPLTWYAREGKALHTANESLPAGKETLFASWLSEDGARRFVFDGEEWVLFHSRAVNEDLTDYIRGRWEDAKLEKEDGSVLHYPTGAAGGVAVWPVMSGREKRRAVWFADENFEADTAATPPETWEPFADGNNPGCVAFHQQRLVLGGTAKQPSTLFMSRSGDYENFRRSRPVKADDALEFTLASGSIDEILWLVSFGELIIGTAGAEYILKSAGAAVTPSDCAASAASFWGGIGLKPLTVGTSILHVARAGGHVRDLYYSWETEGYNGNDLSLLDPALCEESRPAQWAFAQAPSPEARIVREDGVMLRLAYDREQQIYAWSRIVTAGKYRSVCELCGERGSEILTVTEREIGGERRFFLEREAPDFGEKTELKDAVFADCAETIELEEAAMEIPLPERFKGGRICGLADGTPFERAAAGETLRLRYPVKKIVVGFPYAGVFAPLPPEANGDAGTTLELPRALGRTEILLRRSLGGTIRASRRGETYGGGDWKEGESYEIVRLPEAWGEEVKPFSGAVEAHPGGGVCPDAVPVIGQKLPLPLTVTALISDITFA